MTLSQVSRGMLEQIIDNAIRSVPSYLRIMFQHKAEFGVKNEADYVLGFSLGSIFQGFLNNFLLTNLRNPNEEELLEASNIIFRRIRDIHNAILETG